MSIITEYLTIPLNIEERKWLVNRLKKELSTIDYETIVFCGMSGALLAPILSWELEKPLTLVRKEDNSHSSLRLEGNNCFKDFVIIDDCIETGKTLDRIFDTVNQYNYNINLRCKGIFLYNSSEKHAVNWLKKQSGDMKITLLYKDGVAQLSKFEGIVHRSLDFCPEDAMM